jgi:hypothetical protein
LFFSDEADASESLVELLAYLYKTISMKCTEHCNYISPFKKCQKR